MKTYLPYILDKGFGAFSINEAISIKYSNNVMELVITPIPALNEEPIHMEIKARQPGQIRDEIMQHMKTILGIYQDNFFEDIQKI